MPKRHRKNSSSGSASQSKKKGKLRPGMPNEIFLDVLRNVKRQDLESAQLGNRFLRDFIRQHEESELALRPIDDVLIGEVARHQVPTRRGTRDGAEYWTPSCEVLVARNSMPMQCLQFDGVQQMLSCLRLAYLHDVVIHLDVEEAPLRAELGNFCNMVFGELTLPDVSVEQLRILMPHCDADVVMCAVNAFRRVQSVSLGTCYLRPANMRSFDATFFSHVVERGVADFRFTLECPVETRSSAVMPFLLAEPLTSRKALGGHMVVEADFVALVHKRISELNDLPQPVQIIFGCCDQDLDARGFEKYVVKDREQLSDKWGQLIRFTDLPNGLTLEIGKSFTHVHDVVIEVFRED